MVIRRGEDYYKADESGYSPYQRQCDWDMAKGLQAVDGLKTSGYLEELQRDHIEGRRTASEVSAIVADYYNRKPQVGETRGAEADIVSARIVEIVEAGGFSMNPAFLNQIHSRLFKGLIAEPYDSQFRDYNIGKPEPILAGESVSYSDFHDFDSQLNYEFDRIRRQGPVDTSVPGVKGLSNLIGLITGAWQIHPFAEGNTRTVATFAAMALRTLGFDTDNKPFAENALYFRNALVRANYCNYPLGIPPTMEPLEHFFDNAAFNANHSLSSRELYVDALFVAKGMDAPSKEFAEHEAQRMHVKRGIDDAINDATTSVKAAAEHPRIDKDKGVER